MALTQLTIDRNNLHKYNETDKRARVPDTYRNFLARTMTDYRFLVVGPVDDTPGTTCMHAYSAEIGHAVINTTDYSNLQFTVGTWFMADVLKVKDVQLDPIVWKVTAARLIDPPCDQWGEAIEIVDTDQCLVETYGIVTHLTNNKEVVVFSDTLYVMQTKEKLAYDDTICNIHVGKFYREPWVRVRACFSLQYFSTSGPHKTVDSWSILEMSLAPAHIDVCSDYLVTTDTATYTTINKKHVVCITSHRFGKFWIYPRYICGHAAEKAQVGDQLRASFAPANRRGRLGGWKLVRATKLENLTGSGNDIGLSCQLPHLPLNMVDSLPDLPLEDPDFRRTAVGHTVARKLAEQKEALANCPVDYEEQMRQVKQALKSSRKALLAMLEANPTLVTEILQL